MALVVGDNMGSYNLQKLLNYAQKIKKKINSSASKRFGFWGLYMYFKFCVFGLISFYIGS